MRFFLLLLLSFATFSQIIAIPAAEACSCIADPYSKQYVYYTKTWYGTKRKWSCLYTCQDSQQKQTQIRGTSEDWYISDRGLESICDGLYYENRYNTGVNSFVWTFAEARYFDPAEATSVEVKEWEKASCR